MVALAAGCAVIVVGLQAAVAYFQIGAVTGRCLDPTLFAAGAALIGLNVLFALSLTLMLGAFLNLRGAVVGIALGVIFGQQLLGNFVGPIAAYFPNALGNLATMVGARVGARRSPTALFSTVCAERCVRGRHRVALRPRRALTQRNSRRYHS